MLSPLRYPGGKAKLKPFFRDLIKLNNLEGCTYVEPYAGGAGLALSLLKEGLASRVTLNDVDPIIFAFWQAVLNETEALCAMIDNTPVTLETWRQQQKVIAESAQQSQLEVAFATFFLNRTNRSGIIKGAGVIGGYAQAGKYNISSRYYKEALIKRIQEISKYKSKIKFFNKDALEFCAQHLRLANTLVYLDPPYFEKGHRLYRNHYSKSDHENIRDFIVRNIRCPWVVSYDNAPEINALYENANGMIYGLPYTAGSRRQGTEAIFFSEGLMVPELCFPMLKIA